MALSIEPHDDVEQAVDTAKLTSNTLRLSDKEQYATLRMITMGLSDQNGGLKPGAIEQLSRDQVRAIQQSLIDAGYESVGTVDGIAGNLTKAAIEQAFARKTLSDVLTAQTAPDRDDVRAMQKALNKLNHAVGKADGIVGGKTTAGVTAYLEKHGTDISQLNENFRETLQKHGAKIPEIQDIPGPEVVGTIDPEIERVLGASAQSKEDIQLLQGFLKDKGYDVGKADGVFGTRSQKEFARFAEENPDYHPLIGPNLKIELEIHGALHGMSNELKESLNLRDLNLLPSRNADGTVLLRPDLAEAIQNNPKKQHYVDLALKAAEKYDLDPNMFANQVFQESRLKPNAKGPITKYGQALGIAQFLPETAAQYGVTRAQLFNPEIAIETMAKHMRVLTDKLGSQELALIEYNGGPNAIATLKRVLGDDFTYEQAVNHWDKKAGRGGYNLYHNQTNDYVKASVSDEWSEGDVLDAHIDGLRHELANLKEEGFTKPVLFDGIPVTPGKLGLDGTPSIRGEFSEAHAGKAFEPDVRVELGQKLGFNATFTSAAALQVSQDAEPAKMADLIHQADNRNFFPAPSAPALTG